jgi:hypothetical protein
MEMKKESSLLSVFKTPNPALEMRCVSGIIIYQEKMEVAGKSLSREKKRKALR